VRDRGQVVAEKFALLPGEHLVSILPDDAKGAVALVSQLGYVRYLRHHIFGEYMKPGTNLLDVRKFGLLTAACHTSGDGDLFIASRQGKAIRFASKLIPPQGCSGMRLDAGDASVCITSVDEDSSVFMVDANGNGTIRSMAAFTANKSTGGGGKLAMKTEALVMASKVYPDDEIFLISRLSKIIRFAAHEVPVKEGVVQGVRCMALRADQVVAGLITQ
jgi:DNA gyrase/topoisomerase IV subunit A